MSILYSSIVRKRLTLAVCRRVLVQECSDIPRNFNYADGVQFVYAKLVEWLGDDNLDLSIGVLYEFIEVDCDYTHDENAAFKRWQYDHLLRKVSLRNIPLQEQLTYVDSRTILEIPISLECHTSLLETLNRQSVWCSGGRGILGDIKRFM